MFSPKQRMLLLKLNKRFILSPHDYRFPVPSRRNHRADLRVGDIIVILAEILAFSKQEIGLVIHSIRTR